MRPLFPPVNERAPLSPRCGGFSGKFCLPAIALLAGVSLCAVSSDHAATSDTEYDVINGQSNLSLAATYTTGGTSGTGANGAPAATAPGITGDVTFDNLSAAYNPAAFTVGDSALTFGSINDLNTKAAVAISNSTGTAARVLTLGGSGDNGDSVTGSNATDLLYVATNAILNIIAGSGTTALGLALGQSGTFDVVGTATVNSVISGAFQLTKTGAGTLNFGGANTYSGGTLINVGTLSLTANMSGQTFTVASGASLQNVTNGPTLSTSTVNITGTGATANGALQVLGTVAASSSVVLKGDATIGGSGGFSGIIAAPISDGGNGYSLTKATGNYTLTLSGANTYSGSTTLSAGNTAVTTLNHIASGSIGTGATTTSPAMSSSLGAPTTVANGTINIGSTTNTASLTVTAVGTGEVTDRVINLAGTTGGATLTQSGTGALVFTSDFTATGAGSKTLTLSGATAGTGEIDGAIVDNSATNTTSVAKAGTGTWILDGASTFTGSTTIGGGNLQVLSLNHIASGSIGGGATTTSPAASSSLGAPTTVANGTIGIGATTVAGTLTYTGAGETTDRVISLAGTTGGATIGQSGTGTLDFTSNVTAPVGGNKTLTVTGSTAGTGVLAGNVVDASGPVGVSVSTAATTGATTLTFNAAGNPGFAVGQALSGTGIASNTTITAVSGNTVTISNATTASIGTGVTLTDTRNFITSFAKTGTGTWTLGGTNTYSGATMVSGGGTLLITGSTGAGSAVAVTGTGTTLGGTGSIGGSVTVGGGSIISAGAGQTNGTLTTGMLTLASTSTFNAVVTSGTNYSALSAGANSTALNSAAFIITPTSSASFAGGEVLELITSKVTGTFGNSTYTVDGFTFTADYTTNPNDFDVDVSIATVPEPSTWISGILGVLAVCGYAIRGRYHATRA